MRRVVAACVIALALLLGRWSVAHAHAVLVSAEPKSGSRLDASPPRVRLVFSEPLEPALARLSLVGPGAGGPTIALVAGGDPHDVHAVMAPVTSALSPGAYRLVWRVVSADGHPVEGSYTFEVTGSAAAVVPPPAAAPTMPPEPAHEEAQQPVAWGPTLAGAPLLAAAARALALGALVSLAGVLLFLGWRDAATGPAPRGAARLADALAVAAPLFVVLHAAAWLVNASPDHRLTAEWASAALGTGTGRVELWRGGLALLALWALALARRPRLALLFAAAALVASGDSGHSAAIAPAWAVPAKALHLLASAAWVGGVLWLVAVAPARGDAAGRTAFVREAGRVSSVALVSVLVVALSGVAQTLLFLPSPLDVVRSAYGALVLAKVAGLLALVGFGAYHRRTMLPRLDDDTVAARFPVMLRREAAVMGVVIVLGALLAYTPPPASPAAPATTASAHPSTP